MAFDTEGTLVLAWDKTKAQFEDKTADVVSLTDEGGKIAVRFRGTRYPFRYNRENLVVISATERVPVGDALIEVRGDPWPTATELEHFQAPSGRWTRVHYPTSEGPSFRTYRSSEVRVAQNARSRPRLQHLMQYFESVVAAHPPDDPLHAAFARLRFVHPDSALAAFLDGESPSADGSAPALIFPFASNASQRDALAAALSHRISVIEGPPGTGKTQTILNLVANIVREPAATVGVVSFSNAAVDNVYDKLTEHGFGFIAAPLGNQQRKAAFLSGQAARNATVTSFLAGASGRVHRPFELEDAARKVDYVYHLEREVAWARATAAQLQRERLLFDERFPAVRPERVPPSAASWPSSRLLELLAEAELAPLRTSRIARWRWALRRRWHYRLAATVDLADVGVTVELQRRYLQVRLAEIERRERDAEASLASPVQASVRAHMQELSRDVFRASLLARYREREPVLYSPDDLWKQKDALADDYPVMLSTCHSLPGNVRAGRLLDYLIIDESSQVNMATAVLAMSTARRVIVVGDVHQLGHIATDVGGLGLTGDLTPYDYTQHSILTSLVALYGDSLPRTMLREHYRCDARIIDFCNRRFYGGKLLPMRAAGEAPALALIRTAPGHHARALAAGSQVNEREVEVILREALPAYFLDVDPEQVGVVTPFRAQADLVSARMPGVEADTVHKFQGREKPVMVMSTVIDATQAGTRLAAFVDDPRIINVSVSRAQDLLLLVTNPDLPEECTTLRALIEFIEQRSPGHIGRSDLVSIFDVLYTDYATVLRDLASRLTGRAAYRSEEAALVMLEGLLARDDLQTLRLNYQVLLHHLVPGGMLLSTEEAAFVAHRASVDFVISSRVTDQALGVIEVDGFTYHHDNPKQLRRDALKDGILARAGISMLRLPTTGSGEVARAAEFLTALAPRTVESVPHP